MMIDQKRKLLLLVSCIVFLQVFDVTRGFGQIPAGYYDNAAGKTGAALKTALYNIIKNHTVKSYDYLYTAYQTTDNKPNGKVWDMYSDIPGGTPPYEYTHVSDKCGSYNSEGDCYNREHSFPASWFNDASPMYSDLFHLYPTDGYVNNRRSNYPFGTVGSPTWTSLNGSKVGPCNFPGYSGTVFEPRDDFKGDFARSYLYMATRYEDKIAGWVSYAGSVLAGNSYPAYDPWVVNLLLAWCAADPVSTKEIDRNNAVYAIQNNRNPYIDHPEYAQAVWNPSSVKGEPTNFPTLFTVTAGNPSWNTLTLTWSDAVGAVIPDGYLVRGSTTGFAAIAAPVDGTPVTDGVLDKNITNGTQSLTLTGLSVNTTYYFKIFPYTNSGVLINYKTAGTVPQDNRATTAITGEGLLLISQYYEGNGNNQWIEITNTGDDLDLSLHPVYLMIITGSSAKNVTATNPLLCASLNTGIFESGASRLVKNPNASLPGYAEADYSSSYLSFDGTYDVVYLSVTNNTTAPAAWNGRTDVIGEVINNMTTSTSLADRSLYRKNSVLNGVTTFVVGDWNQVTVTAADNAVAGTPERLGFHGFNYFSKATGNLDVLSTWGTSTDGSGTAPARFNYINQRFTVANRTTANLGNTWNLSGRGTGLVVGDGGASCTVSNGAYNIAAPFLEINNGGTLLIAPATTLTITGTNTWAGFRSLTLRNGGALNNSGLAVVKGDLLNENETPVDWGSGTFELAGTLRQRLTGQNLFAGLTVNNPAGVSLEGNTILNGILTLSNGRVMCGENQMLLGPEASIAGIPSVDNMISIAGTGELRKGFPEGFTGSFTFPVGDTIGTPVYTPVTLTFSGGTFDAGNHVGVNLNPVALSGAAGDFLNRQWLLSQSGIAGFTCDARFSYAISDVNGVESRIYCARTMPEPTTWFDAADTLAHQLTASGLTLFGTFTGIDRPAPVPEQLQVEGIITEPLTSCYNATQTITVAGNGKTFVVEAGAGATLVAGQNILILEGSTILAGASFLAYITETSTYCGAKTLPVPAIKEVATATGPLSDTRFKVYPNPFRGQFTLADGSHDNNLPVMAEIRRMTGEKVLDVLLAGSDRYILHLENQPAGVYLLRLSDRGMTTVVKVIKNP